MPKRSIKIEGNTTSLFLEDVFWTALDDRAMASGLSWAALSRQMLDNAGDVANRSAAMKELLFADLQADYLRMRELTLASHQSCWEICDTHSTRQCLTEQNQLLVGRDSICDIVVDDDEVSREHVLLVSHQQQWWALDLGSKNGCRIKRKKIQQTRLGENVTLHFGHSSLSLQPVKQEVRS